MFIGLLQMIEKNDRMIRELSNVILGIVSSLRKITKNLRNIPLLNDFLNYKTITSNYSN